MERELELSCVLVEVENVIECIVRIDANRFVDDLKMAIKSRCEPIVTCAALELQVYLANKDGAWLKVYSAKELTREELLATFQKLEPSRRLSKIESFGAEEYTELEEGEVRVLMALPGDSECALVK